MKPSCVPVAASAVFRLAMSAASAACPTYLIGPVQAGNGPPRRAPHEAATRFRVLIELGKFLPVAAIGEGGQREISDARLLVPRLCARAGRRKSRQSRKGVVPPLE